MLPLIKGITKRCKVLGDRRPATHGQFLLFLMELSFIFIFYLYLNFY